MVLKLKAPSPSGVADPLPRPLPCLQQPRLLQANILPPSAQRQPPVLGPPRFRRPGRTEHAKHQTH